MQIPEFATKEDIEKILTAIRNLESRVEENRGFKDLKYLRSADVRRMLNISDNKLQRLRIKGILEAKNLGGTWFYKLENIQKMMEV